MSESNEWSRKFGGWGRLRVYKWQATHRCHPHWGQHLGGLSIGIWGQKSHIQALEHELPDKYLVTKRTKVTMQKS